MVHAPRRTIAGAAAALAMVSLPAGARAENVGEIVLAVAGPPLAHVTLLPGYVSIIYYAASTEKRMPLGWTVTNLLESAAAGSLGAFMIVAGATSESRDATRAFLMATGTSAVLGAGLVATASILQTTREPDPAEPALLVVPVVTAHRGAPAAITMLVGRF